jgi:hypothetical protein
MHHFPLLHLIIFLSCAQQAACLVAVVGGQPDFCHILQTNAYCSHQFNLSVAGVHAI